MHRFRYRRFPMKAGLWKTLQFAAASAKFLRVANVLFLRENVAIVCGGSRTKPPNYSRASWARKEAHRFRVKERHTCARRTLSKTTEPWTQRCLCNEIRHMTHACVEVHLSPYWNS